MILSNEFTQVRLQVDIAPFAPHHFPLLYHEQSYPGSIFQGYSAASVYHRRQDRPDPPQWASQAVAVATDQVGLS